MNIKISYHGKWHDIEIGDRTTAALRKRLSELVGERPYKLLVKGKNLDLSQETLDVPDGAKAMLLAPEVDDLSREQRRIDEERRREEIVRTRKTVKPRSTATAGQSSRFSTINPFAEGPSTPFLDRRRQMLERLANDPAIREIMDERDFHVGELTELHPHRHPTLLGLNRNAGESIALRLLTDRLDGLRSYSHVLRVLVHELTHNVHGEHELPFKELDSALAKQVAAYQERHRGNRLGGDVELFEPDSAEAKRMVTSSGCEAVGSETGGQRLGDGSNVQTDIERRRAAADAAERRSRQG